MMRLTRNALRCLACDKVIESEYRHDYKTCGCPNRAMVDGGLDYQRYGAVDIDLIENLAEYGPENVECRTCGGRHQVVSDHRWTLTLTPCPACSTPENVEEP